MSIKFTLALIAISFFINTAKAQFPLTNYGYISTKPNPGSNPTPPAKAVFKAVSDIDVTGTTQEILEEIGDAKTDLKKLEITSITDGTKINPFTAHYIYLDLYANSQTIEKLIDAENKKNANASQDEIDKNSIILALVDLKKYIDEQAQNYAAINAIYGQPKFKRLFLPGHNEIQSKMIYASLDSASLTFANNFTILGDGNKAAVNPELIAGFVGPLRFAVNTLISTTKDTSTANQSKLRLLGGGGNTTLTISCPLFRYYSKYFSCLIHLAPKFVADFPLFGASTLANNSFIGSIYMAPEAFFKISTGDQNFSLFANIRGGYIWGTKQYIQNLGLTGTQFNYGQMNVGAFIGSNITISATLPIFASSRSLIEGQTLLTTSFYPQFKKSK